MSIKVTGLTYVYMKGTPFEKIALDNIDLSIETGEFVGIIGHTGSGKSTLVQHFNGLLKPTSGSVYINGEKLEGKRARELKRQVGIVFQYPEHQLFEETVYKDIAFGLIKRGEEENEIDKKVRKTVRMVGLSEDILDKSPFELSGGQKRRVAMAGILVLEPSILVLDEPAAGLDPRGRDEIFELISNLHKSNKMTVVLVSHSMEDVAKYVERVVVMNKGRIEMCGPVRSVFNKIDELERIGLAAPQITYLMKRLKEKIPEINDNILTVGEAKAELEKYIRKA
ncbi:energy-coupling factor transporter ATPase [Acetivibrio straminisolvens]|uniref:Energy-coupling factor transporter ATP-binding protein EcfA2 n=1 Tax=Acetivibrio straminisolvens JCM 21531 TaxID=1294263 RepID=W4V8T6_9FIRM|nr:energy-coupling factor transporter ATPase [Acetivibrio straminisolvens]GAE89566.1 ATPase component of general energizing module of ECF transporters [Acetivibrio straminisolvens JCM 21531]